MASDPSAAIPHRSVAGVRAGAQSGRASPSTPLRSLNPAAYGSPAAGRAEDEAIVIELGCRKLRVGFAGDPIPKRVVSFDYEQGRRTGDFRAWEPGYQNDWRKRSSGDAWGREHELWQLDVRGQDMALVGDKIERALREAFTKYMLIDSKPRRVSLVLPPALPLPLLSSTLDTLFLHFQSPAISLLSSPVMSAFAAGVRSALVVDLGWNETTVTAVYEYREVQTWRTVRAGKMLLEETRNFFVEAVAGRPAAGDEEAQESNDVISFEECEEVVTRMLWCKKAHTIPAQDPSEGLPTVREQDESETVDPAEDSTPVGIALQSCNPPKMIQIPFSRLAEPCETTFFQTRYSPACFDDDELPVHLLVYNGLLKLPIDVRAMCMSRIIFTGGCSNIPGLKGRIFDEASLLADARGWDPIWGKGYEAYKRNPKLNRNSSQQQTAASTIPVIQEPPESPAIVGEDAASDNPAFAPPERDQVEEMIRRERDYRPSVHGTLRAVDTMGPWCGASMATQLKVGALAIVDRELWLQQGVSGASKPNEVDVQAQQRQQRQSMGAGGLIRGQGGQMSNWTLGVFGIV